MENDQVVLLAQQMRDLHIHHHEFELTRLRASSGDPLAAPYLRALSLIAERIQIVEAYVTPNPVSDAKKWDGQRGWSLVVFREHPVSMSMIELADLAFEAQYEDDFVPIELLSWSEDAAELAEAMVTGIRVWPQSKTIKGIEL